MRGSELPLRNRLAVALIERAPQRSAMAATKAMGMAARIPLPGPVYRAAVQTYARAFGVQLDEADPEVLDGAFSSFNRFFTRRLREGAREVDKTPGVLVSPCDGRVREVADIEAQGVVVAKGHAYAIGELLADADLAKRFVGGLQTVIYLHPRDYHRVHAPITGVARRVTAVPGRLLPVNDASVASEPRLFAINERVVHLIESDYGMVAVVMVAAFGVGNMSCAYRTIATHPEREVALELEPPPFLAKGDELGIFHVGSTVVLLTEPGFTMVPGVDAGDSIAFGQALLQFEGQESA